jgi:hypothetical protein
MTAPETSSASSGAPAERFPSGARAAPRRRARRVLLALAYGAFLVVLLEGSSRAFFALLPRVWGRIPGNNSDASWRIRWVQRHRSGVAISQAFDVYHPTRGWAVLPSARGVHADRDTLVNTNAHGLRGVAEHAYAKPPGRQRILVLGDSFTFGDEVNDDETYCADLARMLPAAEILNLGVHGYGHDQMLLYLQEEGVRYAPDVVLLGFVEYDFERNLLSFRDYAKPRFVLTDATLILTNTPVPTFDAVLAAEPYRLKSLDLFTILYHELMWDAGIDRRRAETVTAAILDEIVRIATGIGARPVLVYMPVIDEMGLPPDMPARGERWLLDYCRTRTVDCATLHALFPPGYRRAPGAGEHWDAAEHLRVAEGVRDDLVAEHLVARAP